MLCRHLFLIPGRVGLAVDLVFDMVCSGNEFIYVSLNLLDNMKFMCRMNTMSCVAKC